MARGSITRKGKDKRPLDKNGKPIGRDVRSYTAIAPMVVDGKPKQKWRSFKTEKEAETWLTEMLGKRNTGTYTEPTKQTIEAYLTDWLATVSPSLKASTAASYKNIIYRYLVPSIGFIKVKDLSAERIGKLYIDLADPQRKRNADDKKARPLSSRTVRYAATILKAALEAAVRDGKLGKNPAKYVRPPMLEAKREKRTWTAKQVADFLASVRESDLYAAYHLAASTGLRRGEVCGLRWKDIDFEAGRLTVERNIVMVAGKPTETTPKRGKGRTIAIDAATLEVLRDHRTKQLARVYDADPEATPPEEVFIDEFFQPLNPEALSYRFELAVKASGLPYISLHGLRHTWATLALQAGEHPRIVQERLGHSSIRVTMDIYSHVTVEMDKAIADRVAALFAVEQENIADAS